MRVKMLHRSDRSRVSTVHTSVASPQVFTRNSHLGWASQMISAWGNEVRRALTAGNACRISPSEPSRTTRIRRSAMWRLADSLEQFARRMLLRVSDDRYANPQPVSGGFFRDVVRRVVGSFGMHIRAQLQKEGFPVRLREDHDVVHLAKRRHQQSSGAFVQYRRPGPFSPLTPESAFTATTSVSPSDRPPARYRTWPTCSMSKQPFARTIFFPWLRRSAKIPESFSRSTSFVTADRMLQLRPLETSARIAASNSCRVTTAVPRFITTRPPAMLP